MTCGKVRIVAHRRRREGRTDYRHRLGLLKSGKPRVVVRRSVNSVSCQIVEHSPKGDRSIVTVTSRHLNGFGWKGATGNLPGAYLTGLLCGVMAKEKGVKSAVLDTGLHTSTKGSRIYGTLRGCLDAGLEIPHSKEVIPPEERIRGEHIDNYMESLGKKPGISKLFDETRVRILEGKNAEGTAQKRKPAAKKAEMAGPKKTDSRK